MRLGFEFGPEEGCVDIDECNLLNPCIGGSCSNLPGMNTNTNVHKYHQDIRQEYEDVILTDKVLNNW